MAMTDQHAQPNAQDLKAGTKELAAETAHQGGALAKDAWGHARGVMDEVHGQVRTQANDQAQRAAQGMRTFSGQLRALSDGRPADGGRMGELIGSAETRLSDLAERLEREGFDGVLDDVGRFARRRPGAFLALCAGAGFAMGRVTKAARASQRDDEGRMLGESPTNSPYAVASVGYAAVPSHAAPSITGMSVSTPGDVPSVTGTAPIGADSSARLRNELPGAY